MVIRHAVGNVKNQTLRIVPGRTMKWRRLNSSRFARNDSAIPPGLPDITSLRKALQTARGGDQSVSWAQDRIRELE